MAKLSENRKGAFASKDSFPSFSMGTGNLRGALIPDSIKEILAHYQAREISAPEEKKAEEVVCSLHSYGHGYRLYAMPADRLDALTGISLTAALGKETHSTWSVTIQ